MLISLQDLGDFSLKIETFKVMSKHFWKDFETDFVKKLSKQGFQETKIFRRRN